MKNNYGDPETEHRGDVNRARRGAGWIGSGGEGVAGTGGEGQTNFDGYGGSPQASYGMQGQRPSDPYRNAAAAAGGATPWSDYYAGLAKNGDGIQAPQYQSGNVDQARAQQDAIIQALQRQAAGDMNSHAQQQLRDMYGRGAAQQASLGSTMRGQSAGAAMRGIQQGQGQLQAGLAGDQQMLKLREQQAAQQMLAGLYAQQHAQDVTQTGDMANGQLAGNELNQAMQQFYSGMDAQGLLNNYQYGSDFARASMGLDLNASQLAQQQAQQNMQMVGTAADALGKVSQSGGNSGGSGYRQVDGQDSVVPYDDK